MSKLIAFRLPDDLLADFQTRCASDGLSASAAVVGLVREWLCQRPPEIAPTTIVTIVTRSANIDIKPSVVKLETTVQGALPVDPGRAELGSGLKTRRRG